MSPQGPGKPGSSLFGGFSALLLAGVVIGLTYVARTPGPSRDPAILHVEVMHNSMLPSRLAGGALSAPPKGLPQLVSSSQSSLAGDITSWAYVYGRHRITVHRLKTDLELPANIQVLGLDGAQVSAFESSDLTFLSWQDSSGFHHLVVGTAPIARLDEVGRWFRARQAPESNAAPGGGQAPQ